MTKRLSKTMTLEPEQRAPLWFVAVFAVVVVLIAEVFSRGVAVGSRVQVNQDFWLLDRAAGLVAYEVLALSAILGVSMTSGVWDRMGLRRHVRLLHQLATLLILPFTALHLFGLYEDTDVPFTLADLLIPGKSRVTPLATALGVLSLYAVVVLVVSSYLQSLLTVRVWRTLHLLAFPMFVAVTLHGLLGGTDSRTVMGALLYAIPLLLFFGFTLERWTAARRRG
ncbi:ferric reductase-like transmembrane domain-containing protein [Alicyclobacillus contaminans]|uniref:ferric reductase-like transmembrane domain-containing protein n=1 Tax=Alicyclobacillus contaminans TaxID=392016 RepID=UPI00146FC1BF|nr:ferric reductase-like transmembrane domain-containing protein [Alicyclobacillus contaminans]